ncbi:hypothetical protein Kisp01_66840 [Kineosporia sp. NBRC 101677]|uniref:hypothetical protein n=1 Tax=Kineosporia sp. NBRC 101677 TaxID=3032197 RepID=UPI00249FD6F0|nr:hypothetical protein [Kineosporia sp. NBRC 101677]GLY19670.1 hypothetical protein Kisp01_66840 [Kineosporia sp. NBRC 101677]
MLVVGSTRFFWTLSHRHDPCREVVRLRRDGSPGCLLAVFTTGQGHYVADGLLHVGAVQHADGRGLNLNQPGAVRALLDAALDRGWSSESAGPYELDGWALFDSVADPPTT